MTHELTFYEPKGGAALAVTILNDNENVSNKVANALRYLIDPASPPEIPFEPLVAYSFPSGLAFRLMQDDQSQCIEFLVDPKRSAHRAEIMASVPELLALTGIEPEALGRLRRTLARTGPINER
jgi:hypothetical protein